MKKIRLGALLLVMVLTAESLFLAKEPRLIFEKATTRDQTEVNRSDKVGSCSQKNQFLAHLAETGMKMPDQPIRGNFPVCSREWNAYGTCCHQNDILNYASQDEESIKASLDNVKDEFTHFANFIDSAR
jgi:hypothetical protein